MNKFFSKNNKGFTVVETLVAIAILSLSITATFTAVQNGIRFSTTAKDQITAFYLAQQAVESIKNKRDNNVLHSLHELSIGNTPSRQWLYGLAQAGTDPCYFGKVCQIDSLTQTATYCGDAAITSSAPNACTTNMRQNESNGLYGYNSSWPLTRFKREVQLENVVAGREVRVVVTVSWTGNSGTKFFQVRETLLNRE
ncbi:MAG: type II secretion system protein [Patescibacteria group bacterium]